MLTVSNRITLLKGMLSVGAIQQGLNEESLITRQPRKERAETDFPATYVLPLMTAMGYCEYLG